MRSFQRWGFEEGRAALVGALRADEPVARALSEAIHEGGTPERAAAQAQQAVERLSRQSG